ncbi:uroporphyrinogen decarboxylase [Acetobacteraceae bacterium]|nr:uroporphyrinogen decarboxylase [Acetobacteraceae bacterium]
MRFSSNLPLLKTLSGQETWPPPVWLMRQAGRYLPEFREWRSKADFLTRCLTPEIAAELTLQPIDRYDMDGAILFSDILILPWALGRDLKFPEGVGPVMPPVREEKDLLECEKALKSGEAFKKMAPVREALKILSQKLAGKTTTLLGFAGSPFTVSCYMVEGSGSKTFLELRKMMINHPDRYQKLMEILTEGTIELLRGQIDAGAQAVMLFDSWSGILPSDEFRKWVIEPTKKIRKALKDSHPETKVIGFPRLAGVMVPEYAVETGVDAVSLDVSADLKTILPLIPENIVIQGNLDPALLFCGGEKMRETAKEICQILKNRPHIFNLGHGVPQFTPVENVKDLVETIRALPKNS